MSRNVLLALLLLLAAACNARRETIDLGLFLRPEPAPGVRGWGERSRPPRRDDAPPAGPRVTLTLQEADVTRAVRMLAIQQELDLMIGPGVAGVVSLQLTDVPLGRVLAELARLTENVYRVADGIHFFVSRKWEESNASHTVFAPRHRKVKELEKLASTLFGGKVKAHADEQSNLLFVSGLTHQVLAVRDALERIDNEPDLQVMIEAKFVEVQIEEFSKLGVRWGTNNSPGIRFASTSGGSGNLRLGFLPQGASPGLEGRLGASNPGRGLTSREFRDFEIVDLDLFLDAFERRGYLRILSAPKVTTLKGQTAKIDVTRDVQYIEKIEQTVNGTTGAVQTAVTPAKLTTGIKLAVTAEQIDRSGLVTLKVQPEASELLAFETFEAGDVTLSLPTTQKRTVDVNVQVKDGTTLVIGGLIQNRQVTEKGGILAAGNLPLIYPLFSRSDVTKAKSELVIFLTVRIIRGARSHHTRDTEREVWYGTKERATGPRKTRVGAPAK